LNWPTAKKTLGWGLTAAFVVTLATLVYLRVDHVRVAFGYGLGCGNCLAGSVLIHDAPYLGGVLLCLLAGIALPFGPWAMSFRALALGGMLIYGLDLAVSRQLFTRLHMADLLVFAAQPEVLATHLANTGLLHAPVALAAAAGGAGFLFWPWRAMRRRGVAAIPAAAALAVIAAGLTLDPGQYVHDWGLRNVIEVNLNTGVGRTYAHPDELLAAPPPAPFCASGTKNGANASLIVLILESWSPYQSKLFGGINDWTPRLDRIARDNQYYSRMTAAGFTTNEGLQGLLTGMEFLSPVGNFYAAMPFSTSWGQARTLPRLLEARGYRTAFFTSGNLEFTDKGSWLEDIGFAHVEGHDHPFYEGHPRLHFDAAPDEVLYRRVLAHLDETAGDEPLLIVVESVSSHHPFIHPYTREQDEEAVIRYVDEAAGQFHEALKARGFLETGNLFIVSDHRAMIPVRAAERARWGRATMSRIPAIWAGAGARFQGEIGQAFHQADFIDTVDWNTTEGEVCSPRGRRDMLAPELTTPACLYHDRGDNRDLVDVFCPEGEGTIRLAGDETAMQEWVAASGFEARGDEVRRAAVTKLNRYRLARDRQHAAWRAEHGR
jgi:hypothetical protein